MKSSIKTGLRLMAVSALMMAGVKPALAWDGVAQGKVYAIEVTGGANYGFRVFVSGISSMCGTGSNWGYLNETDSNYKTYVAVIMMAKAQGSPVTLYTNVVNGYCQIGYVSVNS